MKTDYNESEFKGIRFAVHKVDVLSYNPVKSFPEIAIYPEYQPEFINLFGKKFSAIFTYIVLAYDPASPYVLYNDSVVKRKREAMLAAGVETSTTTSRFPVWAEEVLTNKNKYANQMILRFERILKSDLWMTIVSLQKSLFMNSMFLETGYMEKDGKQVELEPQQYTTTLKNLRDITNDLKNLKAEFFTQDNNSELLSSVYDSIEFDDLDITPEQRVKKILMGDKPAEFNPYTQDISVDEYIKQHLNNSKRHDTIKKPSYYQHITPKRDADNQDVS